MAIRPDNLTRFQIKYIIDFYDAQPNASLDATIKGDLKDYKKYAAQLATIDANLTAEKAALELAIVDIERRIARLEQKGRIKNRGIELFEDNIVDRHFELNGITPPVAPDPVPVVVV